jgi:predicted enzyme related to lactoylglutathione lyase
VTESFTFTKLLVRDLTTASAFYEDVFGLAVAHRIEVEASADGDHTEEVFLATGEGPTLALVCHPDREPPVVGGVVIGFTTTDIVELFRRAEGRGAVVERPPSASSATHGYTVGTLVDADGHRIEVVEVSS